MSVTSPDEGHFDDELAAILAGEAPSDENFDGEATNDGDTEPESLDSDALEAYIKELDALEDNCRQRERAACPVGASNMLAFPTARHSRPYDYR